MDMARTVVAMSAWLLAQLIGYLGVVMVGYSIVATYTQPWEPIEKIAPFASAVLTLVATILTAASVYFPVEKLRAAWTLSKLIISPVVIAACGLALWRLLTTGHIPPVLVNGFGLMAIAGVLIRMLPFPVENRFQTDPLP